MRHWAGCLRPASLRPGSRPRRLMLGVVMLQAAALVLIVTIRAAIIGTVAAGSPAAGSEAGALSHRGVPPAGGLEHFVRVVHAPLEGVQQPGLRGGAMGTRPPLVCRCMGDQVVRWRCSCEHGVEFAATPGFCPPRLMSASFEEVLGDHRGLGAGITEARAGPRACAGWRTRYRRLYRPCHARAAGQRGRPPLPRHPGASASRPRREPRSAGRLVGDLSQPRPHEFRHNSTMPIASSPSSSRRDRLRDWIGARESISMLVSALERPHQGARGAG